MKTIKLITLGVVVLLSTVLFGTTAQAQSCTDVLSRMAQGELKDHLLIECINKQKTVSPSVTNSVVDTLQHPDKVAQVAKKYATAAGIMAKEVGMATNEFIKTDAGKIATAAIVWTIFGEDLRGLIFSPIIALCIFLLWRAITRKIVSGEYVEIPSNSWFSKAETKTVWKTTSWYHMREMEAVWLVLFSLAAGSGIVLVLCTGLL